MKLHVKYKDFAKTYPQKYESAIFYPKFIELKNKGFDLRKMKDVLKSRIHESTIRSWFNGAIPLPFKEFSSIKKEFDEDDLEHLALIVGHVFGDGGISKEKFLHYCNTEEFLINEFQNAMKTAFNLDPMIKYKEDNGITRLRYPRLVSRVLLCLFGEFSQGRNNKKITPEIERMPLCWKKLLIRAFYNDDGSVPVCKNYRVISFKQKNRKLVVFIRETLLKLKINSHATGDGDKWALRIMNYKEMVRFKDAVGFSKNYRKQKKLEEIIGMIRHPQWKTKDHILRLLNEGEKTRKEMVSALNLEAGTVYGHLHGWKRKSKIKKTTKGLIDNGFVRIKKNGRINVYELA